MALCWFYQKFLIQLYHTRFLSVIAVLSGLKQKEILCCVSWKIGYILFFAIALSLYQDGSTFCVDKLAFIECVVCSYCKTNEVLNKILFPIRKKTLCLRHYYFLWWPAEKFLQSVGHVKATFSQCFAKQEQAKGPAGTAGSQKQRENGDLEFEGWAGFSAELVSTGTCFLHPNSNTVCRPWCLVLSKLCAAPVASGTGHGNPSPRPEPHAFSCPCTWTQRLLFLSLLESRDQILIPKRPTPPRE